MMMTQVNTFRGTPHPFFTYSLYVGGVCFSEWQFIITRIRIMSPWGGHVLCKSGKPSIIIY